MPFTYLNAVLDVILAPGFLAEVVRKGAKMKAELERIARDFPSLFIEARGLGLLLGLKCHAAPGPVQAACAEQGLMAITAGENTLRLAPPLVVTDAEIDQAMDMLRKAATTVATAQKAAAQ